MPSAPSAKYSRPDHPAMRQMLGPERAAALKHSLAIIDRRLAVMQTGQDRDELERKREAVEQMLRGAMKLQS